MSQEVDPKIVDFVKKLSEKYRADGQDLASYLEGRLYEDYVPYWNYIHLDTLLSLQVPRTKIKDEMIFVMYHQVTELYFKMILHELEQIADCEKITANYLIEKLNRVNRYFIILTDSFAVMGEGMEPAQFLTFRMSLLPASGFQSAQYRMIEIAATTFINLVNKDKRHLFNEHSGIAEMYKHIYWQEGAIIAETGEKTLTLKQFEEKYNEALLKMANYFKDKNVWAKFQNMSLKDQENHELIAALKELDSHVNVNWPLAHYKTAATYLQRDPDDIAATGGTNWQKYLPPRFQKRIFYPSLWTDAEKEEWGKGWVNRNLGMGRI